jgi:hypothetical protein
MALLLGSALSSLMVLYASIHGVRILRRWDLRSGGELQISLERRTYLISTLVTWAFLFQLLSLFLFVYTADRIHGLFVGAMCAAGTLNVNRFGYPAVILKCANFLLAGAWLALNAVDNRGYDYPLIRKKYLLLLGIAPFLLAETVVQALFFLRLRPDVITSCCGALFSLRRQGVPVGLGRVPILPLMASYYAGVAGCVAAAIRFRRTGEGALLYAAASTATFALSAVSLVVFISPYFYENPSHHCPFCVLQRGYLYAGYLLYAGMLGGGATGLGVGIIHPYRRLDSLRDAAPAIQRRLLAASVSFHLLFAAVSTARIATSNLRMVFP